MRIRISTALAIVVLALGGCGDKPTDSKPSATTTPAKSEVALLGVTPDDFVKSFNAATEQLFSVIGSANKAQKEKLKPLYLIRSHSIQDGAVQNVFHASSGLSKHGIIGGIRKESGLLRDLTVTVNSGDQVGVSGETSASDFIIVCRIMMSAISSIPPEDSHTIVNRLIIDATKNAGTPASESVGKVKYSATALPAIGLAFTAQAIWN